VHNKEIDRWELDYKPLLFLTQNRFKASALNVF
jgi:hypothetical protein